MDINRSTSLTLRAGIYAGLAVSLIGLILSMTGNGDGVLWLGILVLIVSPFLGVIVTTVSLVTQKDWRWAAVAVVLICITATGALLSI